MKSDFRLTLELFHTTMKLTREIKKKFDRLTSGCRHGIVRRTHEKATGLEPPKNPFDIPINSTEVTQNRFVPSQHFTD